MNCVNELGMDPRHAKKMITDVDKARDAYHMRYVKYLPNDMNHMDLMINSAMFGIENGQFSGRFDSEKICRLKGGYRNENADQTCASV